MNDQLLAAERAAWEAWADNDAEHGGNISKLNFLAGYRAALAQREPVHPDDAAVDCFAVAMKEKLAKSRAKGRGGWDDPAQCTVEFLSQLLVEHVAKGDPVDVGNLAMMLHQRGSGIIQREPGEWVAKGLFKTDGTFIAADADERVIQRAKETFPEYEWDQLVMRDIFTQDESEPMAEGEVKRFDPVVGGYAESPRPDMWEDPKKGQWVRFEDWQCTEAARLAAESEWKVQRDGNTGLREHIAALQADKYKLCEQLAAERERSGKQINLLRIAYNVMAHDRSCPAGSWERHMASVNAGMKRSRSETVETFIQRCAEAVREMQERMPKCECVKNEVFELLTAYQSSKENEE